MSTILRLTTGVVYLRSISGTLVFTGGQIQGGDGSVGAPFYSFTSDPDTGWYWVSSGVIGFSSNGVKTVEFGTPSGASTASNFFNVTGTLPTIPIAGANAALFSITTAGSAAQPIGGLVANLLAGYTGVSRTVALNGTNSVAGTGTGAWTGQAANYSILFLTNGTTAGHNVGAAVTVLGSSVLNIGSIWRATQATNTPALNIGVVGHALNATVNVGGMFGLMATAPTLGTTCALIADNGAVAADIFQARDNGTVVFKVGDGGTVTLQTTLTGILRADAGVVSVDSTLSTVTAGVYTPTLTSVANISASTPYECQYLRVGATITVSGKADVDPTSGAASTQLGISLPVASNLGAAEDCAGTAFCPTIAGQGAAILGDAANNRAQMEWIAGDVTNQPMYFTFTYQVI